MKKYQFVLLAFSLILINTCQSLRIVCEFSAALHENITLSPEDINTKLCTHINFNYLSISNEFELMFSSEKDHSLLRRLVDLKLGNKNLKIILSVGGWNIGSLIFSIIANNVASRAQFSQSVVDFIQLYDCDGVNIAWMHPSQRGGIPIDKVAYGVLLMDLRATLSQYGYILSIAGGNSQILVDAGYDVPTISNTVDYINVMSYDMKGPYDGFIGHPAQLMPHKSDPIKLKSANQDSVVTYWINQGADPAKLNLGISFHAKKFNLLSSYSSLPGSPIKSDLDTLSNSSEILSYSDICKRKSNDSWIRSSVDSESQAPYMFGPNPTSGLTEWIAYSDSNTMRINAEYVYRKSLGGVTVWSLENDDFTGSYCKQGPFPLLNRLNKALKDYKVYETTTSTTILTTQPETTTTTTTTTTRATTTHSIISPTHFKITSPSGQCICEEDFDYFRNDLTNKHSSTNEDCCDYCLQNSDCKSYTFISITSSCWLKSTSDPIKIKASSRISCKPLPKMHKLVTTTQIISTTQLYNGFKQIQVNYLGNNIETLTVSSNDECMKICDTTFDCNGWTFSARRNICQLKSKMTNSSHDIEYISGFPSFDSFICRSGSFLVPNVLSSCSSFFACSRDSLSKFKTKIINCPANLLFNKLKNQCDSPDKVQC